MVRLMRDDNGVYFTESTYDERALPKEAGFQWDPIKKRWWTKFLGSAMKLAQYADEALKLQLLQEHNLKANSLQESNATDADISIPSPKGLEYLPFQKAGVQYALKRRGTLLADEMGLGKTIEAIGVINKLGLRRVLVICPASLKINWERELRKWITVPGVSIGVLNGKNTTYDINIVNYDQLKKWTLRVKNLGKKDQEITWCPFFDRRWELLVMDEAHYAKNPKAQRSQLAYSLCQTSDRLIFITGTPIMNRPAELYPLAHVLGAPFAEKFWPYARRYCAARHNGYGWDFSGASNLEELQRKLRESIMIRRMKADVMPELPPKRRQIIELPITPETRELVQQQGRWYDQFEANTATLQRQIDNMEPGTAEYRNAVKRLHEYTQASFEEISAIRHETAVAKIPQVIEHVRDLLESVDKLVVFAHHHDVINAIKAAFPDIAVSLTGENTLKQRQAAVDAFQNVPDVRLFVGSIQAAGVGLTLTAASNAVFAELDWVPSNLTQAEDRLHRKGQENSVLIQHLVIDGSIDAKLAKTVIKKQAVLDASLNPNGRGTVVHAETLTAEQINARPRVEGVPRTQAPMDIAEPEW